MNTYSEIFQYSVIGEYEQSINQYASYELDNALEDMQMYNQMIYHEQLENPFAYDSTVKYDQRYLEFPISDANQLCSIYIDKLDLLLPVSHGTQNDTLLKAAGHIYGTSLPVGGNSTHAVIAAHSGLRTSEMFTNIHKLNIGDIVRINVLNNELIYQVIDTKVVLPEECDKLLQIIPNEDLLTLYTCTPYGVNSHRLLVKCQRVIIDNINQVNEKLIEEKNYSYNAIFNLIVLLTMPIIACGCLKTFIKRKEIATIKCCSSDDEQN